MKRDVNALEKVKLKIAMLKGSAVNLCINRGRKRFEKFDAVVLSVYPSVFTVKVDCDKQQENQTFSYFDVLCGNVVINA